MFFSKSTYFKQQPAVLRDNLDFITQLLQYKKFNLLDVDLIREAYNYFVVNPDEFDGATIVKDLDDIHGLDLAAMLHDYLYIVELKKYKGKLWLKRKIQFDILYAQMYEQLGKGITIPYSRAFGLIISTPFYWCIVKGKKILKK